MLNLRGRGARLLDNVVVRNPWVWGALALCVPLLLLALYWPPLARVLDTHDPGVHGWLLILGMSLVPALAGLVAPGIRFHEGSARRGSGSASAPAPAGPG